MSEEDPDGFSSDLLNLINRQKAEIDNLNSELTLLKNDNKHLKGLYEDEKAKVEKAKGKVIDICKRLKTTKSEAIREFAERLKNKSELLAPSVYAEPFRAVSVEEIDNLVAEMTEDNDAE
ncbi:MAG: hypothetical protein IJ045_07095 [Ruminiclostridium sp.]|nr:hypothetical protein [Ruminiclostridium sp.]